MSTLRTPATAAHTQTHPAPGSWPFSRLLATLTDPLTHLLNSVRLVVFLFFMLAHDSSEYSSTPHSTQDRRDGSGGVGRSSSPADTGGRARSLPPSRQNSTEASGMESMNGLGQQQNRRRGSLGWYWIAGRRKRVRREVRNAMGWAFGWAPVMVLMLAAGLASWGIRIFRT